MHFTRTRTVRVLAAAALVMVAAGGYYLRLVQSEGIRFEKGSIEYMVLTPSVLKSFPVDGLGQVQHYYYSASDGNKPLINSIELVSDIGREEVQNMISRNLAALGFEQIEPLEFEKNGQHISVIIESKGAKKLNVAIALLEIL